MRIVRFIYSGVLDERNCFISVTVTVSLMFTLSATVTE